jgi:hypothetical protein
MILARVSAVNGAPLAISALRRAFKHSGLGAAVFTTTVGSLYVCAGFVVTIMACSFFEKRMMGEMSYPYGVSTAFLYPYLAELFTWRSG